MRHESIRQSIIDTCRRLADQGFLAGTGGNVAVRIDETLLAVTPSATDYYSMTTGDICIVEFDELKLVSGDRKPSVETGLHANVLNARRDCRMSIHTHQPVASAFTLLATDLVVQSKQHQLLIGETIPCAGYAPSGTSWLAKKVAKQVSKNVHAYLMCNHGVVCIGRDAIDTMARVHALEDECAHWFEQQLTSRKQRFSKVYFETARKLLARNGSKQTQG